MEMSMLHLRDLVRITGCHASVTDSSIRVANTLGYRHASVIRLLELEDITSRTIISCCPKDLHELDGTQNFRIADVVLVDVEIREVKGTSAPGPLLVCASGYSGIA